VNIRYLPPGPPPAVYPDSDGEPMADNTVQFEWIVTLQGNLDLLYRDRPDVFVAGDHLIYPVEGKPKVRAAPDVYVAFGRPKGHRGSYRVWEEGGVFPQVVFEVLSPNNTAAEMARKRRFYRRFGAEEYYVYDPDRVTLQALIRHGNRFLAAARPDGFVSPRLGIRFVLSEGDEMVVYRPDGRRFLTFVEVGIAADGEKRRADGEKQRADTAQGQLDAERTRADRLAAKLRALGLDPDAA
jgi:Uma2 family endonuclease